MKVRKVVVFLLSFILIMSLSVAAFAAEVDPGVLNAEKFGIWTIVPPLVAIVLAFITKNVVISLFIGALAGCFMLQIGGMNVFEGFVQAFLDLIQRILNSLADPWNAGIILQVLAIGGVISLVGKMGGARAIAEALAKRAKTPRSAQLVTWFLGLLVFFDDYANSLIVGPIMRPVADKLKISRERLAFIIDATAAPIAGLAIISTWIGLEVGLIKDSFTQIGMSVDAFGVFLETIPFRFYNILILAFVVITTIMLRDFGPMRKAELNARKGINEVVEAENEEEMMVKEGVKLSIWNAIIPIGTLILSALASFYYSGYSSIMLGENTALIELLNNSPFSFSSIQQAFSAADASTALFQSAILASIVAIGMAVWKKIFTVTEAVDAWIDGMKGLLITGVILLLAWSLSSVIKDLGTAKYLVTLLSDTIPAFLLPSIIFILGAIISFATGTAYGTMGILMPLAIPLGYSVSSDMGYVIVCTSAVLTGAIFGDHCSPISDTTILSSMGAGCNHIEHVRTQMWYAIFVAIVTVVFGYIPAGFGVPVYIILPIAIVILIVLIRLIGKPVEIKENI
ncbi:Na+/H+ antiporter NhaC family protein [Clostridium thermobutyricum]|uniref:Malate-2H(+)/Na(+)-lactate antiporter n=1 Tax=Clostridium thermobutyricum DSM 4928 TaxID=1121339 RepID=A0A1V4ST94_9CLOT|nr:Na+/H+ antiporter NhaC family protein [Clostridium thermobutyricum]OPX47054.1 malate-2H(+)/Na(+)-lactate antiporter [Clostridium thermobutyricum DSM 4928]